MAIANRLFLLLLLFFSPILQARGVPHATYVQRLIAAYERAAAHPHSCEAEYYGAFLEPRLHWSLERNRMEDRPRLDEKLSMRGDGEGELTSPPLWGGPGVSLSNSRKEELSRDLNTVRTLYRTHLFPLPLYQGQTAVLEEWRRRLDAVGAPEIIRGDEETQRGSFLDPGDPGDGAFLSVNNLHGQPLRRHSFSHGPPRLQMGFARAVGYPSPATDVFDLGHEMSHLMDWAPESLVACLASARSIEANREVPRPQTRLDLPSYLDLTPRTHIWDLEEFRSPRLLELPLDEILRPHRTPSPTAPSTPPAHTPGSGNQFFSGYGTGSAADLDRLITGGHLADAERQFALAQTSHSLPLQIQESAADWAGTEVALQFIEHSGNYPSPEAKRAAVLSILFAYPPMMYDGREAEIMNRAGSKPTNERRMLRIFLAHPRAQAILGCQFTEGTPPVHCPES